MTRNERRAAAQRERTANLKATGRCVSCERLLDNEQYTRCCACLKRAKAYAAMRREINRENGLNANGTPIDF